MTSLPAYSLDTHVVYWNLAGMGLLSPAAQNVLSEAQAGRAILILSHVVVAEFYWLLKKHGQEHLFLPFLAHAQSSPAYQIEGLILDDLRLLPNYPEIPEMHDRLIAIQAKRLGAILVTKDSKIQASPQVQWIW